jgi:hypothetical protein
MKHVAVLLGIVSALALVVACSGRTSTSDWILHAETAHHDADRLLPLGDAAAARTALQAAAEVPVPKGTSPRDARIVRQDLYCRLASLEVDRANPEEAVRWATTGLSLGRGEDVFTANLEIVRGRALERLGDANGASRDYHAALVVTEALLDLSLGASGKTQ